MGTKPGGRDRGPRIAPSSRTSRLKDFLEASAAAGFDPMPHQVTAARYLNATAKGGRYLYPEVADIESRQNGKSSKLIPHIVARLTAGRKIMHTAQNRALPREVFLEVAQVMALKFRSHLAGQPRLANGQEIIRTKAGGLYRIVAPTSRGSRGPANDDLIIDEVREFTDWDFIAGARATLTASPNPQILYLSNAGDGESVVLNALRSRAEADTDLAYLEWSAHPDRATDDREGWAEANPALGLTIREAFLEGQYTAYRLEERLDIFETEHLCRWVTASGRRVVSDVAMDRARANLEAPRSPVMGIAVAPTRASAVLAWVQSDGSIAFTMAADVTGTPLDVEAFGRALKSYATKNKVRGTAYSNETDRDVMRYLTGGHPLNKQELAAASARFASTVESGRLRWQGAEAVTSDMPYLHRSESGQSWTAVAATKDRHPTAALAAIRAVYLATEPKAKPRIY